MCILTQVHTHRTMCIFQWFWTSYLITL